MSDTPNIDELKISEDRLYGLLADPHPGLFTWVNAYAKSMQEIVDFWQTPTEIDAEIQVTTVPTPNESFTSTGSLSSGIAERIW